MSKFQRYLAVIVFIFFEVYAGVRLLTAPADFSSSVVILFGIFALLIGSITLFFALSFKRQLLPYRIGLILAILNLIIGVVCIAFSENIVNMFPVFAVAYGVIMLFTGIDKLGNYIIVKAYGLPRHWLWMVGAILSIVLGIVIIMNPFTAVEVTMTYAGYFLIITGVMDLFTFIFSFFF